MLNTFSKLPRLVRGLKKSGLEYNDEADLNLEGITFLMVMQFHVCQNLELKKRILLNFPNYTKIIIQIIFFNRSSKNVKVVRIFPISVDSEIFFTPTTCLKIS
jgi:hypothetical protein